MNEGYRDLSDASYQLAVLKQQRDEAAQKKADTYKNVSKLSSNLWKMYSKEQDFQEARKLESKFDGKNIYEQNPEYLEKGPIQRSFTPASGRVQLTDTGKMLKNIDQYKKTEGVYEQGLKDNPWLTEGDDFFDATPEVGIKDINDAKKFQSTIPDIGTEEAAKLTESGPKTFKEYLGEGNKLGYLGVGMSAYDTLSNWSDRDSTEQAKSVIDTSLAIGSAVNPALLPFYLGYQLFK